MSCSKETWVKECTPGVDRLYKVKHTLLEDYREHRRNPSVHTKPAWLKAFEENVYKEKPLGTRCCANNSDSSDSDYDCNDRKYQDPELRLKEWYEVDYIGVNICKEFSKEEREAARLQPDDNQLIAELDVVIKYTWLPQKRWFNIGFAEDIVLAGSNKYSDNDIGKVLLNVIARAQNALQKNGYAEVAVNIGSKLHEFYEDGRVTRVVMYNRLVDGLGAFVKFEEEPFTEESKRKWSIVAKKFLLLCSRTYTKYHKRHFDRRQAIRNNLKNMLTPDYE